MDVTRIRVAAPAVPHVGAQPGPRHGGHGTTARAFAVVLVTGVLTACTESPELRGPVATPTPTLTAEARPLPVQPEPAPVPPGAPDAPVPPGAPDAPVPPVGTVPMPTVEPKVPPVPMPTVTPAPPPVPMPPHADRGFDP